MITTALKTKKIRSTETEKANCSALTVSKRRGKRRADCKYRNREGACHQPGVTMAAVPVAALQAMKETN